MAESPHHSLVFGVPDKPIDTVFAECVEQKKCFIILYHDPATTPDIPSEYETPHYHGLVRATGSDFTFERAWVRVRDSFRAKNIWFKSQKVWSLSSFCAYLKMPGKQVVINQLKGVTKETYDSVTQDQIERQVERKTSKVSDRKEDGTLINKIRTWIFDTGVFTEDELAHLKYSDPEFERTYMRMNFRRMFEKAAALAGMRVVDMSLESLFELAEKRTWETENYYSANASLALVHKIMEANKIKMSQFVTDAQDLMDKRRPKVNTLWLHGSTNAGKSYISRSFERLASLYHSVPPGSNRFMFQDCVNKRLIVLNEPYLDESSIEACKAVMEGTGCFVPVKNKADQYLRATPVIITSNTFLWQFNSQAKAPLLSRCYPGYMKMVSCDFLAKCSKELHPLWLRTAIKQYSPEPAAPSVPVQPIEVEEEDEWEKELENVHEAMKEDLVDKVLDRMGPRAREVYEEGKKTDEEGSPAKKSRDEYEKELEDYLEVQMVKE